MDASLDPTRQEQAREYARQRQRLSLIGLLIGTLGTVVLLVTGLGVWLRTLLEPLNWEPVSGWYPLRILGYFLILLVVYELLTLPLTYRRGFVLPRHYGLLRQDLRGWLLDLLKGLAFSLVLEVLALELVYLLLATQPQLWWLWVALAMLCFSVVLANLGPVLLLPRFYKFTPLPDGELKTRLVNLLARARTSVAGVYVMQLSSKTTGANAALMGLGNTRRIALGDTMLGRYTDDEIEVVLAHELGHHVHKDLWKLLVSQSLLILVALYIVNLGLHWSVEHLSIYQGLADIANLPLVVLISGAVALIFTPLSNAFVRAIEYQADEYALSSTGKVEAFKSTMTRLANQNLADVEPSPLVEALFHDHPSINKRLRHAETFAARQPQVGSAAKV